MTREEFEAMAAEVLADQFAQLRADLESAVERLVATKALPPFVPPAPWLAGTHGAGVVVRHRNGLFMARRDTASEPPDDAWLPLLVGLAGVDVSFTGDRVLTVRANLSDGTKTEAAQEFAVPIMRGSWEPEAIYHPGDRVLKGGEYQATAESVGVDPSTPAGLEVWVRVGGKARSLRFTMTDDGDLSESGQFVGSIKPLMTRLLDDLLKRHAAKPASK